jgi:hypothetical protein
MKHLKLFEDFSQPDWHSGYEFGKPRNQVDDVLKSTSTTEKKIAALEKKRDKILLKSEKDKNLQVSVRKHIMTPNEKVHWRDAIKLIDTAISNINKRGSAMGIIVYI